MKLIIYESDFNGKVEIIMSCNDTFTYDEKSSFVYLNSLVNMGIIIITNV